MALIADILLISGAFGAALYCMVLSRRLSRLSDLDGGLGKAISDLDARVSELSRTVQEARASATTSASTLTVLIERAEAAAAQLDGKLQETAVPGERARAHPGPARPDPRAETRAAPRAEAREPEAPSMPAFIRGRAVRTAAE